MVRRRAVMKISFIGAGNMASAIINSVVSSGRISPDFIYVFDKFSEKANALSHLGINVCNSLDEAIDFGNVILLAVKPQDYENLLSDIKGVCKNLADKTFISIAAGISCEYVTNRLCENVPVVRVMPNTPLMLGVGATAISRNSLVSDKMYSKICTLFAASGTVCSLDESLMNSVISVNSSSPVYLYLLAKAMIEKSISYGISESNSTQLVYQTLKGSVEMLIKSGKSPDELIKTVASPGGTTLAAISSLEKNEFDRILFDAMDACTNRAFELSK